MAVSDFLHDFVVTFFPKAKRNGDRYRVSCPVPDHGRGRGDRNPSLSVGRGFDGRLLLWCHAGCHIQEICSALGITERDLFPPDSWREPLRTGGLRTGGHYHRQPGPVARRPEHEKPRSRPPRAEVERIWDSSRPVTSDSTVRDYLSRRRLDPVGIDWYGNIARAIPKDIAVPPWASCKGLSWSEGDWRLLVPLFGPRGDMKSVHARSVLDPPRQPKGVSPRGFMVGGLVMADCPGQSLLLDGNWWSEEEPCRVLIVEGATDHLKASTSVREDDPLAPAVLGILSGSWSQEIADRIPVGSMVTLATHDDRAGDRYADAICETLVNRCRVYRTRPEQLGRTAP